jgi:alkylmercury lyase
MNDGDMQRLIRLWRRKLDTARLVRPWADRRDQFLKAILSPEEDQRGARPVVFEETRFAVQVRDSRLHARTALDCLALPILLEEAVWVSTSCLASGRPIAMHFAPQGILSCEPETCMMTVVPPEQYGGFDTVAVRRLMGFFASPQEATLWLMPYPEVAVLPIQDAWQFTQRIYT